MDARVLLLLAAVHSGLSQETFRTGTGLVMTPVRVTERSTGKPVEGLKQKDFEVYDQGVARSFAVEEEFAPVTAVIAVQTSAISGPALAKIQKIGGMIQPLVAGERGVAAVLTYSDQVTVRQEFTADAGLLTAAFRKMEPDGRGSRMHDGLLEGVRMLAERRDGGAGAGPGAEKARRRVLIVIGETRDRSSEHTLQDVITAAQAANVVIYPVSYSATWTSFTTRGAEQFEGSKRPVYSSDGGNLLAIFTEMGRVGAKNGHEALAKYTGGLKTSFVKLGGLEQVVQKLSEDLHAQYLLSFAGVAAGDGKQREYRVIQVRVRGCGDCVVRHRPGYFAE